MKTKEERNAPKKEAEAPNRKHAGLYDEQLVQVSGGFGIGTASGEYGLIEIDNEPDPLSEKNS